MTAKTANGIDIRRCSKSAGNGGHDQKTSDRLLMFSFSSVVVEGRSRVEACPKLTKGQSEDSVFTKVRFLVL